MSNGVETEAGISDAVPVIATIALTEADIRAGLADMAGGIWQRGVFMAVLVGAYVAFAGSSGMLNSPAAIAPVAFLVLVWAAFSFLIPSRNAKIQIEVLMRAGNTNVTYRFDSEGITIQSANATTNFSYRGLVRTRRGKHALLLYTNGQIAQLVPLRAFTAEERTRVLAFLPPNQKAIGATSWKRVVVVWVLLVVAFLGIWLALNSETPSEKDKGSHGVHNHR